ncbi:Fibromodulin [Bagarius yarrelli]|uniref:Fibromodulin n=1 Tax=Bagarius yarrelli TaxID=175774 RepID=A0A556U254_BAGYA|nr:Fibromodulin [Bagarius yarrelli]
MWGTFLLWAGLVYFSPANASALTWLNYLRSRAYSYRYMYSSNLDNDHASLHRQDYTEALDCPLECECPPSYPTAMYCHNRNLQHVPFVPSRMKYVYLQNNRITGITDGVFDNATELVWIILNMNQLRSDKISSKVFARLSKLERLFLQHNKLEHIPEGLPYSLQDLRLDHNAITSVPPGSLRGMKSLTALRLHYNAIKELGMAVEPLASLSFLDVRGNQLSKIPESLPPKLNQLYLDHNQISSVPMDFVKKCPELHFMRLSHNRLTDAGIPPNTFNVSTLMELDLSHNKLEKIPAISTSLQNLYLQANRIKEFSISSFCQVINMTNYSNLRVLRLEANKIGPQDVPPEALLCLRKATSINL